MSLNTNNNNFFAGKVIDGNEAARSLTREALLAQGDQYHAATAPAQTTVDAVIKFALEKKRNSKQVYDRCWELNAGYEQDFRGRRAAWLERAARAQNSAVNAIYINERRRAKAARRRAAILQVAKILRREPNAAGLRLKQIVCGAAGLKFAEVESGNGARAFAAILQGARAL